VRIDSHILHHFSFIVSQGGQIDNKKRGLSPTLFLRKSFDLGLCCRVEETLFCQSPHSELGRFCWLRCRFQHIFNENAIPGIRGIHQHVGNGADEFPVLDDGAAGHADVKQGTKEFCFFCGFYAFLQVKGRFLHLSTTVLNLT